MSEATRAIAAKVDVLAKRRKYWRELCNAMIEGESSPIVHGLKSRIKAKSEELQGDLNSTDPTDSISIAKAQAGKKICDDILSDFDIDICRGNISRLDELIKIENAKLDKVKKQTVKLPGMADIINK